MFVETQALPETLPFEPIECDYLDGENVAWAKKYLDLCQGKLEASAGSDPRYEAYLQVEIAAYRELLQRFNKL